MGGEGGANDTRALTPQPLIAPVSRWSRYALIVELFLVIAPLVAVWLGLHAHG